MKIKAILAMSLMFVGGTLIGGFQETGNYQQPTIRLSLRAIENQTLHSTFKCFYANSDCLGLIKPKGTLLFEQKELYLQPDEKLCLTCVQGSFQTIYIKDEGRLSGPAELGYEGPYYLSMWLEYPDVTDEQKIHVGYLIKLDDSGNKQAGDIAVRIDPLGNCQILALKNIKLLS